MSDKRNEIPAREWEKTLTEEQLDTYVHLRDNWGDVVVSGNLRTLLINGWIKPFNGVDLNKTNVAEGDVYLGAVFLESEDTDRT